MNKFTFVREVVFFLLMIVAAIIGGYIGLHLRKISSSSGRSSRDFSVVYPGFYAFLIFSSLFIGITISNEIHNCSSSWDNFPIEKYLFSFAVALVIYIYKKFCSE